MERWNDRMDQEAPRKPEKGEANLLLFRARRDYKEALGDLQCIMDQAHAINVEEQLRLLLRKMTKTAEGHS